MKCKQKQEEEGEKEEGEEKIKKKEKRKKVDKVKMFTHQNCCQSFTLEEITIRTKGINFEFE